MNDDQKQAYKELKQAIEVFAEAMDLEMVSPIDVDENNLKRIDINIKKGKVEYFD